MNPQNVKWEIVQYTRGKGLELAAKPQQTFPHFVLARQDDLGMFASQALDFVFVHMPTRDLNAEAFKEWWRIIKVNGHLCIHTDQDTRPIFEKMSAAWDLVDDQDCEDDTRFQVYRKLMSKRRYSHRDPKPEKTAAVVRYGAFGDLIQASSVFPGLKAQGFHVTLYCAARGHEVVKEDPHVDRFIIQDTDQVPNQELGAFWDYLRTQYTRFVNLSESVEGSLLALPGRANHAWPYEMKQRHMDDNYLEFQHEIAGVPYEPRARFYTTEEERVWARKERAKFGRFVILWSLTGSSIHKVWPYLDEVIVRLLQAYSFADVVLASGEEGQILEAGWAGHNRVHKRAGVYSIRQSMAMLDVVNLVVGPETGLLNAAGLMPVPKIVTMSHSSENNLTRDWVNVTALKPNKTPCYPCHILHYSFEYCHRDMPPADCPECKAPQYCEGHGPMNVVQGCDKCSDWVFCAAHRHHTGVAKCQASIGADVMFSAIVRVIEKWLETHELTRGTKVYA